MTRRTITIAVFFILLIIGVFLFGYFLSRGYLRLYLSIAIAATILTLSICAAIAETFGERIKLSSLGWVNIIFCLILLTGALAYIEIEKNFRGNEEELKKWSLISALLPELNITPSAISRDRTIVVGKASDSKFKIEPQDTSRFSNAIRTVRSRSAKNADQEIKYLYNKYPDYPYIINLHAFYLLDSGDTTGAENEFRKAATFADRQGQREEQVSYLLNIVSQIYFLRHDYIKGIYICDQILSLDPNNAAAIEFRSYFSKRAGH